MKPNVSKKAVVWTAVICAILIITVIAYYIYVRKKGTGVSYVTLPNSSNDTVLKYGSRGEDVKTLQRWLNAKIVFYYADRGSRPIYNGQTINSLVVDGIFGVKTQAAVKWWFNKDSVTLNELV